MIIPARGGSKRIKNKNIKKFKGKPIIYHTLETILKSKLFDVIHISTDSLRIRKVVEKKIKVDFLRPKNLANNTTPIYKVILYVINYYKKKNFSFDEIWCMMPCAPNIKPKDLVKASIFFKSKKKKLPVITISKYKVPIEWANKLGKNNVLHALNKIKQMKRSQDLVEKYYDAGQFYIFPSDKIFKINFSKNSFLRYGFILPFSKSIDIDDYEDWKIAEKIS